MNVHVLPGDAIAAEFAKAGIPGEAVVCRESLVAGPLDAADLDQFWERRANFIALEYAGDPIEYREHVANELERLLDLPAGSEVNLWFEYELFCQANMWFCLHLLRNFAGPVYRVQPLNASPDDVWEGFGKHEASDLSACFDARVPFSEDDRAAGRRLWSAFRDRDASQLLSLAGHRSPCFPFLNEVCEAAAEIDVRPLKIVREIKAAGPSDFETVFPEFKKRAGVYGFGDLQVARLLETA